MRSEKVHVHVAWPLIRRTAPYTLHSPAYVACLLTRYMAPYTLLALFSQTQMHKNTHHASIAQIPWNIIGRLAKVQPLTGNSMPPSLTAASITVTHAVKSVTYGHCVTRTPAKSVSLTLNAWRSAMCVVLCTVCAVWRAMRETALAVGLNVLAVGHGLVSIGYACVLLHTCCAE
jgi:hypothetical protein